jgi:hypothetical protein
MSNIPGFSAVSTAPPPSDAIEAAALAAALAENALESELESERKERTVGSFEHTPQHLYGPCFGFVESSWSCSGGGDWGSCDCDSRARRLLRVRNRFRGEWGHAPWAFGGRTAPLRLQ